MADKPKVLLLGDSIRLSYQPIVANLLAREAEVVGPEENGQFSLYTASSLNRWLRDLGTPALVHWNNGIHDAGHNPDRYPEQIPLEMYYANLELILRRLLQTGARIIWATTTPVHPSRPVVKNTWWWHNEEIDRYNTAALDLMQRYGVAVNDLHAVVQADCDKYLAARDGLHLSESGQNACAQAVATAIRAELARLAT